MIGEVARQERVRQQRDADSDREERRPHRLRRVADWTTGEQPHRMVAPALAPLHQIPRCLQPMAHIDRATEHVRVVARDVLDILWGTDEHIEAGMGPKRVADAGGDLGGRPVPGRGGNQDSHRYPPVTIVD